MMGESGRVSHKGDNTSLGESLIVTGVAGAAVEKYAHFSPPFPSPSLMMLSVDQKTVTPVLMLDSLIDFIQRNGWNKNGS